MAPTISYAQRYEDMHLLRVFAEQATGFYIDIGAGHPVYDNVSFAFYLRGWGGITVEPNPWLARLSEAVRPRDSRNQGNWIQGADDVPAHIRCFDGCQPTRSRVVVGRGVDPRTYRFSGGRSAD